VNRVAEHQHHDHQHPSRHGDHKHHVAFDTPEMAATAEVEGELLGGIFDAGASRLADVCRTRGVDVRRILDLGCGPAVGTCVLAERFPAAQVVGVDGSEAMLAAAADRIERSGLGHRVTTRLGTFPDDLPSLGRTDVVWASLVLHHVGDEVAALRAIRGLVEPDGVLALLELDAPLRVVVPGADADRPGLWERLDAAWTDWFAGMRAELPDARESDPYPAMLDAAGFDVVVDDVLTVAVDAPLDGRARQFAQRHVDRMRTALESHAEPADLAALDALAADDGIARRDDVALRATRHLFVAVA
jgi:SAM-dependent methyltransferase